MNHWISSDWHLGHQRIMNILRPEFNDIKVMNETILFNMFENVRPGDQFYFLGDLIFTNYSWIETILNLIKDKRIHFHFILGNHDKKIPKKFLNEFASVNHMKNIKINDQKITLSHYPMISWNCSHWGAWQLYGHHHRQEHAGDIPELGKQLNVNCEFHNFKPWNFEEIKEIMKNKKDNWNLIKKEE